MRRASGITALVAAVLASDLASKAWARTHLAPLADKGSGALRLGLVQNRGGSFGIGADHPWVVATTASLTTVVLAAWLVRATGRLIGAGLAMALGGGLGNLLDRVARGSVTDWVHVTGYPPTFNVADVMIRAGLLIAVLGLLRCRSQRPPSVATAAHSP